MSPGSLLNFDWYNTRDGRNVLSTIYHRDSVRKRIFGLLEKPSLPPSITAEDINYKIFLSGKSGVGKTSTVATLTGNALPSTPSETPGINVSNTFWPVKMEKINKISLFKLQFWDAGDNAIKKFDHILPACTKDLNAVMFVFSFIDKSSFDDIPNQIARLLNPDDNISKIAIGAKFDQHSHSEITQRDIKEFEKTWKIPVLKIKNLPENLNSSGGLLDNTAGILNTLCENLWYREIVAAGKADSEFL